MRPTHTRKLISSAFVLVLVFLPALAHAVPPKSQPDVLVFTNGDTLTGTFVREVGGKVTFHSDMLGDLQIPWKNIKEIHTGTTLAVIRSGVILKHGHIPANLPLGTLAVSDGLITVHPANRAMIQPIPVASAQYIVDQPTFNKQILGHPRLLQAWNGAATVGLTLVQATQNQYSFSAAIGLARVVPTVNWLDPRNRTTINYAQSYGKITEPSYTAADGAFVPSTYTKSSIFHADAERDEYVSPRFYFLGTVVFDHNYSQSLDLQQIYGGGVGYTLIKTPVQELDLKAVAQYEHQAFFSNTPPPPPSKSLIASTFGGTYLRHITKGVLFTQQLLYIPAWNDLHAYSFSETDNLALPVYKNFSFSLGTLDTYLNDVPLTYPPTKRNSFQFTAGVTYNIKSTY
ncbi:MAG TPA: DUF481 domain-containing protein [Acidobacteriaceae bacterium]|nr:DUF481 domain-containing protein [Acidobacteriaceae bacterium]